MKSFRYSVVIYSSVVPGYVLGGYLAEWLDRKFAILLSFLSVAAFGTLFCARTVTNPDNDVCRIDSLLSVDRLHGDIHYTSEVHPTEIRTTAMGIASAWGRVGAMTMLLVFGHYFATLGKSLLFLVIDPVLIGAAIVVLCFGPSTRGRPLQETQLCR